MAISKYHRGAYDEANATLAEVAKELGVSIERVRQIEAAALKKARPLFEVMGVTVEDIVGRECGLRPQVFRSRA